jgi:RNA polymerase sigma-70 factor (ECF subfamily)
MEPDEVLMKQVKDDVPGAFEELIERYQHPLVSYFIVLTGNTEQAEDIAQEVLSRVWRSRKKYVAKPDFSTWLYTIALEIARKKGSQTE